MVIWDTEMIGQSAAGGALIGLAAAGMLLVNGRIAGVSGILGNAIRGTPGLWRYAFLAGLLSASFVAPVFGIAKVVPTHQAGLIVLAIAGFAVGIGTQIGNGCTSGHGVCGVSNLSLRSLTATVVFVSVAMLTVLVTRHILPALMGS